MPIDVEVSDVAVHALAHVIGQPTDRQDVSGTIKCQRIVGRQPLLSHDFVVDRAQARVVGLKGMVMVGGGQRIRHLLMISQEARER